MCAIRQTPKEFEVGNVVPVNKSVSANLKEEITRLHSQGNNIADLEEQLENVQKSIDKLVTSLPTDQQSKSESKKKKLLPLASSNGANRHNFIRSPCSPLSTTHQVVGTEIENRAPENGAVTPSETPQVSEKDTPTRSEEGGDTSSKEGTPYRRSSSVNMRKMQKMFQNAAEENVRSIRAYVTELKERVAKLQYQKQLLVCQVILSFFWLSHSFSTTNEYLLQLHVCVRFICISNNFIATWQKISPFTKLLCFICICFIWSSIYI